MRLDRFLAKHLRQPNKLLRAAIQQGDVLVDGRAETDYRAPLTPLSQVQFGGKTLPHKTAYYWMLNKPAGVISATKDDLQPTVCDLVDCDEPLHIAGRLDKNTTGLVLLTNNGTWSKALARPERRVPKVYWVECDQAIPAEAVAQFAAGMYFAAEQVFLLPAVLEIVAERRAKLTLYEGRYHQIKRMFGRFGIRVLALHRESVAHIRLDPVLKPGEYRALNEQERAII